MVWQEAVRVRAAGGSCKWHLNWQSMDQILQVAIAVVVQHVCRSPRKWPKGDASYGQPKDGSPMGALG